MNRLACVFLAGLFVVATGFFVLSVHEAAACPGSDSANLGPYPIADTATSAGHFDTEVTPGSSGVELPLLYQFRETPFIAVAEVDSVGSEDINEGSVEFDPAYWFPTQCEGYAYFWVRGDLAHEDYDGTLSVWGRVSDSGNPPPYAEDFHEIYIYASS